jgi:hypothetical protein
LGLSVRQWAEPPTAAASATNEKSVKVGDLLGYLPTPSLLVELSLLEKCLAQTQTQPQQQQQEAEKEGDKQLLHVVSLDDFFQAPGKWTNSNRMETLAESGAFFVHTTVQSTETRDAVVQQEGSGKSLSICTVDTPVAMVEPGGAYLGLGLANHHVVGYYWARSMGIGASLPAHGIYFGPSSSDSSSGGGELYWKKRGPGVDPSETTEEASNSNDGKRSEWADYLQVGDTVQLVPNDPLAALTKNRGTTATASNNRNCFPVLIGIRRTGRPLGADPIVEKMWTRRDSNDGDDATSITWIPL